MEGLPGADRLIVAADFKPALEHGRRKEVEDKVMSLAKSLRDTGVIIKVNSALRSAGYDLITRIRSYGVRVFADLKLIDIPATLEIDGMLLKEAKPYLVTVMCQAGVKSIRALKAELPNTEILGVTALTHLEDGECQAIFGCSTAQEATKRMAKLGAGAPVGGLISAPTEVEMLKADIDIVLTFNTPGIRPLWHVVQEDDQSPDRVMTPAKAIKAGTTRLVIGRPITQAADPLEAVKRTLDEIVAAAA